MVARQRPGTAKGIVFLLLEDEFGTINLIVPPDVYERHRLTVRTEPLILARGRDPELFDLDLRALDARSAEAVCDRIAATGALEEVRDGARARVEVGKRVIATAHDLDSGQRDLLAMVADGVVERYA